MTDLVIWTRGDNRQITDNFHLREFECKCKKHKCKKQRIDRDHIKMLERLRHRLGGHPIRITSGYRCKAHNQAVRGSQKSQHMKGTATDIVVDGCDISAVVRVCKEMKFKGIGKYATFTHVDSRKGRRGRWSGKK